MRRWRGRLSGAYLIGLSDGFIVPAAYSLIYRNRKPPATVPKMQWSLRMPKLVWWLVILIAPCAGYAQAPPQQAPQQAPQQPPQQPPRQPPPPPPAPPVTVTGPTLTLAQAVQLAIKNHPQIAARPEHAVRRGTKSS